MCDRSPLGFRLRAQAGEVSVLSGAPYGYRLSGETRPVPNSENCTSASMAAELACSSST